mgnify:CR=1 FL=1
MNRWMKAGLWIGIGGVLFGAAFVVGRNVSMNNRSATTAQIVLEKKDEKGQIVRGRVAKYDIVSLTVATESGGEMSFPDLTRVSVWVVKDDGRGGSPQKADWTKLAVEQKVSLSMDSLGQKLISVIVYE